MDRRAIAFLALSILLAGCSRTVIVAEAPPARPGPERAAHLGIPPGHLPPPGQCRVWIPGRPPGRQSPPGACAALATRVPPGGWLVYGSHPRDRRVKVSLYDSRKTGVVIAVRFYERKSGRFIIEERR